MIPPGYKRIRLKFSSPLLYHNHRNEMRLWEHVRKKPLLLFALILEINQNHGRSEMRFINGIKWEVLQKKRMQVLKLSPLVGKQANRFLRSKATQ